MEPSGLQGIELSPLKHLNSLSIKPLLHLLLKIRELAFISSGKYSQGTLLEATPSDLFLQLLLLNEIKYSLGQLPIGHAMSRPLKSENTFNLTQLKESK